MYENERILDFAVVKKGAVTASPSQAGHNWKEVEKQYSAKSKSQGLIRRKYGA